MGIRRGTDKLAEGFSGISIGLKDFRFDADINMNADVKNLPKELLDLQIEKSLPPSRDPKKFSIIEGNEELKFIPESSTESPRLKYKRIKLKKDESLPKQSFSMADSEKI